MMDQELSEAVLSHILFFEELDKLVDQEWFPSVDPWHGGAGDSLDSATALVVELNELYEVYGPEEVNGMITLDPKKSVHAEVGDDHVAYMRTPVNFLAELASARRLFGVQISKSDTFISEKYGNFSESFLLKPESWGELASRPLEADTYATGFLDVGKTRTVLPVSGTSQRHSATIEGKVALLSKQRLWAQPFASGRLELLAAIQHVCLGLNRAEKFSALPDFLGGYGAPPIGGKGSILQFHRQAEQYKRGKYHPLIRLLCQAAKDFKEDPQAEALLRYANAVKHHWQTWYTRFSRTVPTVSGRVDPSLDSHSVYEYGSGGLPADFAASRLTNLGLLKTEVDVIVHQNVGALTKFLLSSGDREELLLRLKESQEESNPRVFRGRWGDDLVSREIFLQIRDWHESQTRELLRIGYSGDQETRRALRKGQLYDARAIDAIYEKGPLRVQLQMQTRTGLALPIVREKLPDEYVERQAYELLEWLRGGSIGDPPRVLLDDDPVIISLAIEESEKRNVGDIVVHIIHTDDIKLAREINYRTGDPVVQIPVGLTQEVRNAVLSQRKAEIARRLQGAPLKYLDWIDTGSVSADLDKRAVVYGSSEGPPIIPGLTKSQTQSTLARRLTFGPPRSRVSGITRTFDRARVLLFAPGRLNRGARNSRGFIPRRAEVSHGSMDPRTGHFEVDNPLWTEPLGNEPGGE